MLGVREEEPLSRSKWAEGEPETAEVDPEPAVAGAAVLGELFERLSQLLGQERRRDRIEK